MKWPWRHRPPKPPVPEPSSQGPRAATARPAPAPGHELPPARPMLSVHYYAEGYAIILDHLRGKRYRVGFPSDEEWEATIERMINDIRD